MATRFEVRMVTTCTACGGTGEWPNEKWEKFFRDHPQGASPEEINDWMRSAFVLGVNSQVPPGIVLCAQCNGTGEIGQMIDLQLALHHLDEKRYNDPPTEAE